MKKILCLLLALVMVMGMFAACGDTDETPATNAPVSDETKAADDATEAQVGSNSDVVLTFMTNVVGEKATALEAAIRDFEAETGYTVEFSAPGDSYEELMKTKMASNELPDVFTTHGWSVARYSEYLMPVNDMDFASRISDQIKPVITDAEGNMYVLPIDIDIAGMVYNVDVLESCGINVDDLTTWEAFADACAVIEAAGIDPMHIGGKDTWTIGQFFDWVAPSFYVTDEANSKAADLKAGTFDTAVWTELCQMLYDWTEAGYFNTDVLTADYSSDIEALATGTTAFCFYGNYAISDAMVVNADANLGMMPIPSNSADDEPTLIAGEDIAIGIWKDTAYSAEAQELLEYLARPEVCAKIAEAAGNAAGLTDVTVDLGVIQTYLDKYNTVETFAYFDREYLPSGMWDVMCSTGAEILALNSGSVEDAASVMEQSFMDKYVG
ncbi:MAG: extracellular solute-binding protein [Oscillospiraceae bacterium]|nr:extracellular solute-binding protein [Oscillospiraceae bacterium]